jgi:hypothetical protein
VCAVLTMCPPIPVLGVFMMLGSFPTMPVRLRDGMDLEKSQ